jgi:hypothetical protein
MLQSVLQSLSLLKSYMASVFSEILISGGEFFVETIARDGNSQIIPLDFEGTDHSGRVI